MQKVALQLAVKLYLLQGLTYARQYSEISFTVVFCTSVLFYRTRANPTTKESIVKWAQARREPQRGPGKHSRPLPPPKHFHGAPQGRKFLNFSSENGAS